MFDWITNITENLDYWSLALLMFLENIFPPIPSEIVMPAAGFTARSGRLSFAAAVAAGTVGSVLGTTMWYYAGRWLGEERLYRGIEKHGKWIAVKRREAQRAVRWFCRWGSIAVLIGRMVPGIRTLISVPAGFADMPLGRFLFFTTLGTVAWNTLLAWLGWLWRDNYQVVGDYVGWFSLAVISAFVLWWLVRMIRRRTWRNKSAQNTTSTHQ